MTAARPTPLVFVVEDDPTTNRMVQGILTRAGFQVAAAFDAAGALTGIRARQPDLILLDINLPDGNGLDVCRQLQREPSAAAAPVLFISSNDDVPTKLKGFEAGAVDYIPKPFAGEEVIARVSTHLRLKSAYESLAELHAERLQRLAGAQETLMPQPADLPQAHFQIALRQVLDAGGDFYDVVPAGEHIVDYVVADASGHDLAASFWTAALKALVSEYANPTYAPKDILRAINSALCRILPAGVFFTLIYARLNRQSGRLQLANAGHPPLLWLPAAGAAPELRHQEGDVAGAFADAAFGTELLQVQRGDRLLLYSDGLIECGGPRAEGLDRLQAAALERRQAPLADWVPEVLHSATRGRQVTDDIVLMGVEV